MPPDERQRVMERFETLAEQLHSAGLLELLSELASDPKSVPADGRAWLAKAYFAEWLACPFLENEQCSIYDERPTACRLQAVSSDPTHCRRGGGAVRTISPPGRPAVQALAELESSSWLPMPMMFSIPLSPSRHLSAEQWIAELVAKLNADSVVL